MVESVLKIHHLNKQTNKSIGQQKKKDPTNWNGWNGLNVEFFATHSRPTSYIDVKMIFVVFRNQGGFEMFWKWMLWISLRFRNVIDMSFQA